MTTRCYLDWNATAPLRPEASAAAAEALGWSLGNPASVHAEGRRSRRLVERARAEVAEFAAAGTDEVVFTSGGSESNATGLWGLVAGAGEVRGRPLLVAACEHPAVKAFAAALARLGAAFEEIPVGRDGTLDLGALREAVARRPGATVAVQLANSETGVVQDLAAVAGIVHAAGGRVHSDAVQAAGKLPIPAGRWGVDTLALAGHKLGAPHGIGALVVRGGVELAPLIPGSQEAHRRGGTENVGGAVAFGVTCRLAADEIPAWLALAQIRDAFEQAVGEAFPDTPVYGRGSERLPNTSCVGLPAGLRGGAAVAALDLEGFAVSSGPACGSGVERRSPAVEAMGFGGEAAERTLRVSLGPGIGKQEVLGLVAALERIWRRGRGGAR